MYPDIILTIFTCYLSDSQVKKALRGIRVEFSHGDYMRRYKVLNISTHPLRQLT